MGARALQARMGAPSAAQARCTLLWKMRQEIGMCALRGHAKVIIVRARLERTGTGNGGGTRTDSDDDGNPDEWAEGAATSGQRSPLWLTLPTAIPPRTPPNLVLFRASVLAAPAVHCWRPHEPRDLPRAGRPLRMILMGDRHAGGNGGTPGPRPRR
ncbi:hypothetical protein T492DRAFT_901806 [Pavlovales sp. CCMP2436]|nr:hypothetical protein T492DRAFT_901806 [Pavlovales sp. CCMP2436]